MLRYGVCDDPQARRVHRPPVHHTYARSAGSLSASCNLHGCRRFRPEPGGREGSGCAGAGGPGQQAGVGATHPDWLAGAVRDSAPYACMSSMMRFVSGDAGEMRPGRTAGHGATARIGAWRAGLGHAAWRCRSADDEPCSAAPVCRRNPVGESPRPRARQHWRVTTPTCTYCGACMERGTIMTRWIAVDKTRARARQFMSGRFLSRQPKSVHSFLGST